MIIIDTDHSYSVKIKQDIFTDDTVKPHDN